ncbi:MAG: amino acid adenylation domain-containing protein [Acidobacteriota bacterium]
MNSNPADAPDLPKSARDAAFDSRPDDDSDPGGIGILSFAVRFPGASTVEALWANFAAGRETIVRLSDDELRAAGVSEAEIADPSYVKARGMIDGADRFDAALFGFTPREAELTDPQHRLLLEVAWEALDAAGIDPGRFDAQGQRIGVFVGSGVDGYLISNILPNAEALKSGGILQAMILNDRDFLASRLAYELNLKGPAVVVQSACSTALLGVHLACQSLLAGECDVAIAGGSSIAVPLVGGYRYSQGDILSPDGHCRSFDARAEGTVPSSGVGVAVLERADRARAAGRPLRAVIRGTATNNDGSSRVGFTAPSVEGQAQAIAEALGLAEVSARDVAFVEAHGSATPIGDPIEIAALSQAFRADSQDTGWCAVGSAKSNFGHANSAAGLAGLARAALAIEHATIPPTLHFERPNREVDLAASPFYVPTSATPWPAGAGPRRAGVSSFGLGGTNVHAVLEQAPEPLPAETSPRPLQPLFLSANSPQALETMTERLADYLAAHPETDLADVAWTLAVGRRAFKFRRAVVASNAAAAAAALRDRGRWLDGAIDEGAGTDSDGGRPVAFLFPGLGDQYPGFARGLYDAEPAFREEFDRVAAALGSHLEFDLRDLLFGGTAPAVSTTGLDLRAMLRRGGAEPAGDLAPTERAQPALFAVEVALARLLERWGVKASALVGYSLGELSAAYVSGALPLAAAARLVATRARWIAELPAGSMLAVPLPAAEAAPYLSESVALAATNGPHLSVLSGPPDEIAEAGRRLAENGVACLPVSTTHAFHSPALAPLGDRLTELVRGLDSTEPEIPRLSNVSGSWIGPEDLADPAYWSRHMTGTVRFAESLGELLVEPRRILVEVGPGATLGALARQHPAATAELVAISTVRRASEGGSDFSPLLGAVARLWTLGAAFEPSALWAGERRRIVDLPSYPFERQRYWIDAPKDGALGFVRPVATGGIGEKRDVAEWFSLPDLSRTLAPDVPTPADLAASGPWLVVAGGGFEDLAEPLAQRLEQAGAEVSIVRPEEPLRLEPWVELIEERAPRRIVVLGGFGAPDVAGELGALCRLAHALGALPVDLLLVGSGLLAVTDEEPRDPEFAALAAAFRVVGRELPHGAVRALDLAADISVEASLDALLAEALAPADRAADLIARRGRSRWVRVWQPVRLERREPPAAFAPGAPILITDAANGVGPALAEALALRGARLALLLPPDFPAEGEWEAIARGAVGSGEEAAARALLAASRATEIWRGSTDEPERALKLARARFGRLAGVCHTASGAGGGLAALLEPGALAGALAPDFTAARRWANLLDDDRQAFLAFFPSNLGATGSFGQLELAAAGAFQACLAEQLAASGRRAFAPLWDPYQWGGWLAAGVGQLTGSAGGDLSPLSPVATPPGESAEAFIRLLAAGVPSLVVSARDFATVLRDDATVDAAALSRLATFGVQPAGERAARLLATPYVAPRSPTETALAGVWSELFGIAEIGRDDDFLALGGHSLLAIQLATAVRTRLDFELPITAIFDAPTVAALGARIDGERLGAEEPTGPPTPPRIVRVTPQDGAGDWPLSFDQERLWFLDQLEPGGTAYNIDLGARMRGVVDLSALYAAAQEIFRRHAAWRTFFPEEDGVVVQRVLPWAPVLMPAIDLSALPGPAGEATALRIQLIDSRTPFALDRGPLARLQLLRLAPRDHICLLTVHHTVTDWITFQYFWKELAAIYDAYRRGLPSPLREPPVQYPDFVLWQRDWLRGEALDRLLAHWRQALDGVPLFVDLPADRPWPPVQSLRGGRHEVGFGSAAPEAWRQLGRRAGATSFMVLVAGIAAVLHRFSGQERLIIGTPSANRTQPELEQIFGFFITQLAIPIDLSADPSFVELVTRTRRSGTDAFDYQDVPFTRLVDALEPERTTGRAPIIQVAALLLDKSFTTEELPDLKFEAIEVHDGNSRFDLLWGLYEWPDDIRGRLEWNFDVFEAATVARLQRGLEALIAAGIAAPERPLSELELIAPSERHQIVTEWNDTAVRWPGGAHGNLYELFAAQCERTPDAPAVVFSEERLTYRELALRANALAWRLRRLGVRQDAVVGVLLDRSLEMVVALYGVLAAGAAYLPLEPTYPEERLAFLLADARPAAVLSRADLAASLPAGSRTELLAPGAPNSATLPPPSRIDGANLAYVIYTSGSTGRPKGAMVPHAGIRNRLLWMQSAYRLGAEDRVLQKTPFSFDVSVWELFWPLAVGACLVVAKPEGHRDPSYLAATIREQKITTLHFVPSLLRDFLDAPDLGAFPSLKRVICSGEALAPDLVERFRRRFLGVELHNLYGPTEASVDVTFWPCPPTGPVPKVPIGFPVANTAVHVLDRSFYPAPVGVSGELYLSGVQLARGYLGRPSLTAERFVPDPYGAPGSRLYRTGDRVRRLAEGAVEYQGRLDFQVKVRGVRIEPGEIEDALRRHPQVAEAAVVARNDGPAIPGGADEKSTRLVAYVVSAGPEPAPSTAELREFLAAALPEAFVPGAFVLLPALPRNTNGKLDRAALPAPDAGASSGGGLWMPPSTTTEFLVADVWAEVLGIDQDAAPIGADDSFFDLGGHSLLAAQVAHRLAHLLDKPVPVRSFFQFPTLARFAAALDAAAGNAGLDDPPGASGARRLLSSIDRGGPLPLSFGQERLWFLDRMAPGGAVYNLPLAIRCCGPLHPHAFGAALGVVVSRHEALRTTFDVAADGRTVQVIAPAGRFRLPSIDLAALGRRAEFEERRIAHEAAVRPFDLARGPLLRVALVRAEPELHLFLLVMHHIVSDAWSMGVLVREATAVYRALVAGRTSWELPALPIQYPDFAAWQRGWLQGPELERQVGHFRSRLGDAPEALDLPTDRPRPALQSLVGAALRIDLPEDLSASAFAFARAEGATDFMLVFAAWAAVLARWAGVRDLVLGTTIANRDAAELEGLIGFFINTLPLRIDASGDPTFAQLLARVRAEALDGYAHRDVPFEKLVEELKPARDRSRPPIVQAVLTWQNAAIPEADLGALHLSPQPADSGTSKFDLTVVAGRDAGRIRGLFEYATALFEEATIHRVVERLADFLAAAVADRNVRLSALPLLAEPERRVLLVERNQTATAFPRDASIAQLFAEQVLETPDSIAIEGEAEGDEAGASLAISYGELGRRAMKLARRLAGLGVSLEMPIAILAERAPETLVGILGILAAGGCYVPIDPTYPPERQALLLEDCGAAILLGRRAALDELPSSVASLAAVQMPLDADAEGGFFAALDGRPERPSADSLAYVMYTSGSTGRPKGVWVTHRNVIRLVRDTDYIRFGTGDVFLLFAPIAFDASTLEIWGPLLNGGRIALAPSGPLSPAEIKRTLARFQVTTLWLTAGLFHPMADYGFAGLPALSQLLAGGDALSPGPVRQAVADLAPGRLIDGYGPTEGTTFTCCFGVGDPAEVPDPMPIGRPISNARVYVLDADLEPVVAGAWGELYAGGEGIARGYLRRPDLTAERFVPDPFADSLDRSGGRLYRTGDVVRWNREGVLEFQGRRDGQVKIRGFRIELGEVESALLADARVREAVAIVREDRPGDRRLVAYVALRDDALNLDKLRHLGVSGRAGQSEEEIARDVLVRLAARLPEPFVPGAIVVLDALPLTANGKLDRRALPAPDVAVASGHVEPASELEAQIATVAAEVLGLARVGMRDNFFDLGGHSLLATRFVAELEARAGVAVPLQEVFDARDLGDLADRIVVRELAALDDGMFAELLAEEVR